MYINCILFSQTWRAGGVPGWKKAQLSRRVKIAPSEDGSVTTPLSVARGRTVSERLSSMSTVRVPLSMVSTVSEYHYWSVLVGNVYQL